MAALKFYRAILLWCLLLAGFAAGAKPVGLKVFFFLDPECPISNAYMREIKSIYADYATKGIAFEAVFPVTTVTETDIQSFLKKYKTTLPGYKDANLQKVKRYKATVMPEAVLVNSAGIVVYKGAIDNWYYALGKSRAAATEHYLRNAIEETLSGSPVMKSRAEAYGCLINL